MSLTDPNRLAGRNGVTGATPAPKGFAHLEVAVPQLMRGPDEVLAPLEVADTAVKRARGLLGRDGLAGALLLRPCSSVHTFRMRFALDIAYLDKHLIVLDTVRMPPGRLGRPRLSARSVLEAEAGSFERWGLRPGDRLGIGT